MLINASCRLCAQRLQSLGVKVASPINGTFAPRDLRPLQRSCALISARRAPAFTGGRIQTRAIGCSGAMPKRNDYETRTCAP